jgi:hypothetical protein
MKNASKIYERLYKQVSNGEFKLDDFESLIRIKQTTLEHNSNNQINEKWRMYFKQMMDMYKMDQKLIDQRFKQFDSYLKLNYITKIANIVVEIKNKNNLTGDFNILQELSSFDSDYYKKKTLNDLDEQKLKIFNQLEELSQENFCTCLKRYIENYSFVEWLRKNAPSIYST